METVRILHLEDNDRDGELIQAMLETSGLSCDITRVQTRSDYVEALHRGGYDLIMSDFSLPSFDGDQALRVARENFPDLPFIFVSGTIGEENAIQALLSGATDYLLKTHMNRLAPAIHRALRESEQRMVQKELNRALRESEAKYRQIVDTTEDGIWMLDGAGNTSFVNPRMAELLGLSTNEIEGKHPIEFVAEVDRTRAEESFSQHFNGQRQVVELRFRGPSSPEIWALVATTPMMDDDQYVGGLMMLTDITEKKKLEAKFLQAQKMEAVGRLAGGVAHDFNNLLTAILGNCEFVLEDLGTGHPSVADVNEIRESAERAASLTRQLLAFSRQQIFELKPVELDSVASNMERLIHRLIGENINLRFELDCPGILILADAHQLEQVILNLAINARDSMAEGGDLVISTCLVPHAKSNQMSYNAESPVRQCMLSVSDTGCGMDAETLEHVFEPFFTTKEAGKGTGLGLSTVYEILRQVNGAIEVESKVGNGTAFRITFPVAADTTAAGGTGASSAPAKVGSGAILMAEDEESLRYLLNRILSGAGYEVTLARDAEEAIEMFDDQAAKVQLLVTDIVLPRMSGVALAELFQNRFPGREVLLISGYSKEMCMSKGIVRPGFHFLQKPFPPDVLLRKVREILTGIGGEPE